MSLIFRIRVSFLMIVSLDLDVVYLPTGRLTGMGVRFGRNNVYLYVRVIDVSIVL